MHTNWDLALQQALSILYRRWLQPIGSYLLPNGRTYWTIGHSPCPMFERPSRWCIQSGWIEIWIIVPLMATPGANFHAIPLDFDRCPYRNGGYFLFFLASFHCHGWHWTDGKCMGVKLNACSTCPASCLSWPDAESFCIGGITVPTRIALLFRTRL